MRFFAREPIPKELLATITVPILILQVCNIYFSCLFFSLLFFLTAHPIPPGK